MAKAVPIAASVKVAPWVLIANFFDYVLFVGHGRGLEWVSGFIAKEVATVLQTYVLPPLYGLVGAIAYVLRRLIADINARTYQEDSNTSYNLRLFSGVWLDWRSVGDLHLAFCRAMTYLKRYLPWRSPFSPATVWSYRFLLWTSFWKPFSGKPPSSKPVK
jgi:hypothetical protein